MIGNWDASASAFGAGCVQGAAHARGRAVLIFEDPAAGREIRRFLDGGGWNVAAYGDEPHALDALRARPAQVVVAECSTRGAGPRLAHDVAAIDCRARVVLVARAGAIADATASIQAGAYLCPGRPFVGQDLLSMLARALREHRDATPHDRSRDLAHRGLDGIVGDCPAMLALRQRIARLLQAEANVRDGTLPPILITGETGTGKELVARALHVDSVRREGRFASLNCAFPPPDLRWLDSAEGGTLFLDEVGEADAALQLKLLDLLEERRGARLDSIPPRRIDVRIVAATSRDLERMVREGRFRADLYFRLRVVTLALPPLRERGADVSALMRHFLALHGDRYGKGSLALAEDVRRALLTHSWPGNVRELRNLLEQAVLLAADEVIGAEHIGSGVIAPVPCGAPAPRPRSAVVSRTRMQAVIEEAGGNVTQAARMLGISRDTLRYRLRKHGVSLEATKRR